MAKRKHSRGTCKFCGKDYARTGMTRHLKACKARKAAIAAEPGPKTALFHLIAQGTYNPQYWLHLEAPADIDLYGLDRFLRNIWVECCGHLSLFRIQDQNYVSLNLKDWWNPDDKEMDVELGQVLRPGIEFDYEYDFGSTTHLSLRVADERQGTPKADEPIRLMARNHPPDYRCQECGQPATLINVFEDYALLCDACVEAGEYPEDGFLPVVNSPRMGVCGYTGDAW